MERLTPPPQLAREHDRMVELTRRPAFIVEDAGLDLANGADPKPTIARARRKLREALAEAGATAGRLGVPACRPPRLEGL
jgi:hypothetical protein